MCDAPRAAGIEVWFDRTGLCGGDIWDRQVRKQIHDCALFHPNLGRGGASRIRQTTPTRAHAPDCVGRKLTGTRLDDIVYMGA
jgi:hypothetical protein